MARERPAPDMQLNRFTDYGLRVLIFLCSQPSKERVSLEFLARTFNMNRHHLHKVSQRLSQLGWINSARGKKGGISLAPAARELNLGKIIGELETDINPIDCEGVACPITGTCRLQGVLLEASEAFMSVLSTYRLEDLQMSDLAAIRLLDNGSARAEA